MRGLKTFGIFWIALLLFAMDLGYAGDLPVITSISIQNNVVTVKVSVPKGIKKVTLESRSRVEGSNWAPKAVQRLDGTGGEIEFGLPSSAQLEILRVVADSTEPLPANFFQGRTSFVSFNNNTSPVTPGAVETTSTATAGGDTASAARTVTESDIWKVDGNRVYYFNQNRGLQVIDVTDVNNPQLLGEYRTPGYGEQMYAIGNYAILLTQNYCANNSEVEVIDTTAAPFKLAGTVSIPGYNTSSESRLIGSILYLASQSYKQSTNKDGVQWIWGTVITSVDLTDPANPKVVASKWIDGYNNTLQATDRFIFVAVNRPGTWGNSDLHVIDVSAPDGTMVEKSSIALAGQLLDKFKINLNGNTLTAISQVWGSSGILTSTMLETYDLSDASLPVRLGSLQLGKNEALHATRFDGDKVYIVTFQRIDPLFVVDLSNPAKPAITGQVDVSGWSSYIQPLGDKLVTIGIEASNSWRVAVSLFDVKDMTKPALLSRVILGQGDNGSYSEANWDEKAFNVLPDAGLILVPYMGWSTNGSSSKFQLIDLGTDKLTLRGTINHQVQPRRATVVQSNIVSISASELLSVKITDRDNPEVAADLELSWSADRIAEYGDYLLQIDSSSYSYYSPGPTPKIRVTTKTAVDTIVGENSLDAGFAVTGTALKDNLLYVALGKPQPYFLLPPIPVGGVIDTNPANFFILKVFKLDSLPKLELVASISSTNTALNATNLKAYWPATNTLVLYSVQNMYYYGGPIAYDGIASVNMMMRPFWGYSGSSGFIAIDVTTPSDPKLASYTTLGSNYWSYTQPLFQGPLAYTSFQTAETVTTTNAPSADGKNTGVVVNWVTKNFLQVVDFTDPYAPVSRNAVNIPGQLAGLGRNANLLYTTAYRPTSTNQWSEFLDVSAYDGVSASLVDSLLLPSWPRPLTFANDNIYLGRQGTNYLTGDLEIWTLPDSGKFTRTSVLKLHTAAQSLDFYGNKLLAREYNSAEAITLGDHPQSSGVTTGGYCYYYFPDNLILDDKGIFVPNYYSGVQFFPFLPADEVPVDNTIYVWPGIAYVESASAFATSTSTTSSGSSTDSSTASSTTTTGTSAPDPDNKPTPNLP